MNLQFVFGNPTKKSKSGKKVSKNRRKTVAKRRKKTRRKNPERITLKVRKAVGKTPKGRTKYQTVHKASKVVLTTAEIAMLKAKRRLVLAKAKGAKKPLRKRAKSLAARMAKVIASKQGARDEAKLMVKSAEDIAKQSGPEAHVVRKSAKWTSGKKAKKRKSKKRRSGKKRSAKKSAKRRSAKRRSAKRRSGSKRSVVLKRRGSKIKIKASKGRSAPGITVSKASNPKRKKRGGRKSSKRRSSKRRSSRSLSLFGKRKSVRVRVRKGKRKASFNIRSNPLGGIMGQVKQYTGHETAELISLAAGGALYGAVNGAAAKYAKPLHNVLVKVPVVGTALPTLVIGALLNYLGERQNIAALKTAGKGLVGASVVGMGVNLSQQVPALKALSGVDYTMEGYGDDADFGYAALPEGMGDDADFGGVDYTMEGDDAQMGEIPYSGVDYTMEGYGDEADFGEIPEGMGQGQMG